MGFRYILPLLLVAACSSRGGDDGTTSGGSPGGPGDASGDPGSTTPGSSSGTPAPLPDLGLGARIDHTTNTVSFRVWSDRATRIEVDLYAAAQGEDEKKSIVLVEDAATSVWSGQISLADVTSAGITTIYYGYRAWGPNWPYVATWTKGAGDGFVSDVDAAGNRFDPNKLLYDPYALELSHDPFTNGGAVYETGDPNRTQDSGPVATKGIVIDDGTGDVATRPTRPLKDDVVYEVQVRGLTMQDDSVDPSIRGTYLGAAQKAAYLKSLGVTAVELLPLHETQNDQNDTDPTGQNYWGYATLNYFAPDRRFASDKSPGGPTREVREMVRAFHAEGLKVFVDVVYNHTGEGNSDQLLSWRGLDAPAYYETQADPTTYVDNNGVGANFNPHTLAARQLVLDSLRYWSGYLGVDGFRFDLAAVLGDSCAGVCFTFDKLAPDNVLNRAVATLPARPLAGGDGVDLIAEPWAIGAGTYQLGNFPKGWAEWNGSFRDVLRTAQNRVGVADVTPRTVAQRLLGSPDLFGDDGRPPGASINFFVAHDGFTLRDLYTYDTKNNEQPLPFGPSTGGSDDNISWAQNGVAADQVKAARTGMLLLASASGVPMMVGGDEIYRTQRGNNNAYNLDTSGTWLDWASMSSYAQQHDFTQGVFALRAAHAALRPAAQFEQKDHDGNGLADVTLLDVTGNAASAAFLDSNASHFLGLRFDGAEAKDTAASVLVLYNWAATAVDATLPAAKSWVVAANSDVGLTYAAGTEPVATATMHLPARTAVLLLEH